MAKKISKTFNDRVAKKVTEEMTEYDKGLSEKYKDKDLSGYHSLDGRVYIMKTKAGESYMKEYANHFRELTVEAIKKEYGPSINNGYKYADDAFDTLYSISVYREKNGEIRW